MRRRTTSFVLGGLVVSLLLAGVVSRLASSSPDGLDSASTKGCVLNDDGEIVGGDCIARGAKDHELADSPLADYGIQGIDNEFLSTGLSGVLGVLLTFAVGAGIFWLVRRRPQPGGPQPGGPQPGGPPSGGPQPGSSPPGRPQPAHAPADASSPADLDGSSPPRRGGEG